MATISTPVRQPFGVLNESKLRSLQSMKNRQNAITPSPQQSLKRRAPSPENSDSENVDPFQIDLRSKRKRAACDDDVSLAKQPRLHTHIIPSKPKIYTPPAPTRQAESMKPATAPLSAPPAAGRSPTRLHSRYDKSQTKRRFAPPSLKASSPSISIAAALRGTLSHKRSVKSRRSAAPVEEARPKSWFFDIFEESDEQQDYRMSEWTMTQSSAALEISDDESKGACFKPREKGDRGKENIDPNEMSVTMGPVTRSAAAAAATELAVAESEVKQEPLRTPLGDLNAADFYAEGLDATSVALVHDDYPAEQPIPVEIHQQTEEAESHSPFPAPVIETFTFEAPVEIRDEAEPNLENEPIPEWAQQASMDAANRENSEDTFVYCDADVEPSEIEIWESESAKGDDENQEQSSPGCVVVGEGQTISLSASAYLQEI